MAMNAKIKILLVAIGSAALGAAAVQGLHAQTKPKAFLVTESEVLNAAGLAEYTAALAAVQKAAGGRSFGTRGKIIAVIGDPPKRVGISEWDSAEQTQMYLKSAQRNDMVQTKNVVKISRQYIVEASQ
jgi:uncharacterized protein (DUF1330 family)